MLLATLTRKARNEQGTICDRSGAGSCNLDRRRSEPFRGRLPRFQRSRILRSGVPAFGNAGLASIASMPYRASARGTKPLIRRRDPTISYHLARGRTPTKRSQAATVLFSRVRAGAHRLMLETNISSILSRVRAGAHHAIPADGTAYSPLARARGGAPEYAAPSPGAA